MNKYRHWDGTVLCPIKGLSHISHRHCLELYEQSACGTCPHKDQVLQHKQQDAIDEQQRKAERKALTPTRKKRNKT